MKVYEMVPGKLYQRGRTNRLPLSDKVRAARELRLGMVVGVCPEPDLDWAAIGGIQMVNFPFGDGKTIPAGLLRVVDQAAIEFDRGRAILVYCNAGRNRSSLFTALLLMHAYGWTGERAIEHVRLIRPRALANADFEAYIRERC